MIGQDMIDRMIASELGKTQIGRSQVPEIKPLRGITQDVCRGAADLFHLHELGLQKFDRPIGVQ